MWGVGGGTEHRGDKRREVEKVEGNMNKVRVIFLNYCSYQNDTDGYIICSQTLLTCWTFLIQFNLINLLETSQNVWT